MLAPKCKSSNDPSREYKIEFVGQLSFKEELRDSENEMG
jgi:hypothetical protein